MGKITSSVRVPMKKFSCPAANIRVDTGEQAYAPWRENVPPVKLPHSKELGCASAWAFGARSN